MKANTTTTQLTFFGEPHLEFFERTFTRGVLPPREAIEHNLERYLTRYSDGLKPFEWRVLVRASDAIVSDGRRVLPPVREIVALCEAIGAEKHGRKAVAR